MSINRVRMGGMRRMGLGLSALALSQMVLVGCGSSSSNTTATTTTTTVAAYLPTTPIKHVIVIIGENHSFDNVFATYMPKNGNGIWNLLSQQIVKQDGSPGTNFSLAQQQAASDTSTDSFLLSPTKSAFAGGVLPAPLTGGPKDSYITGDSVTLAQETENGLPASYYQYLVSGGTGQASAVPDVRIANVNALPTGPFQLTSSTFSYDSYSASPVHRFYQMWQQLDCNISHATALRPSGCDAALFSWVETTVGAGANGIAQPANFSTTYVAGATTTGEGSTALGFYNMINGDVPYFKSLADQYAISDNFHQSVNGGTGANHIMLGHGDMIWFSDGNGNAMTPPHNAVVDAGTANAGTVDEIENPNAAAGTNNWYSQDGYGGGSYGSASYGGGSYTNCSDTTQPGVAPIVNYLKSLPTAISSNCQAGHYYLLNNYNPGYFGNGNNAYTDTNANNTVFTIPPSSVPSIGDSMNAANVSWKYYGDQWNNYVNDPYQLNWGASGSTADEYSTSATRSNTIRRSWPMRPCALPTSRTLPICIRTSLPEPCLLFHSSSRADTSTATRLLPSWICLKASRKRSSAQCKLIRRCGPIPQSSSPSTKAAATTIPAMCNRSTSSATAPVSRSSWFRLTQFRATCRIATPITFLS